MKLSLYQIVGALMTYFILLLQFNPNLSVDSCGYGSCYANVTMCRLDGNMSTVFALA